MALNFQGDRAVGVLNDPKNTFNTDDLFRVYDGGILVAGGVSVDHGDFVSWDGTKWVKETGIRMAATTDSDVGSLDQQSSNIAPNYTKKTYEANSYVMHDGKLYTNPAIIHPSEDWNPAHWTQTTVAEMIASVSGYIETYKNVTLDSDKSLDIGNREAASLRVTSNNSSRKLTLNCSTDCSVRIYSDGQDFSLLVNNKAGVSLSPVTQYPKNLSLDYITIPGGSYDEVTVVEDGSLYIDRNKSGKYCYVRVTGGVALVLWTA